MTEATKDKLQAQEMFPIQPVIEKYRSAVGMIAAHMGRAVALLEQLYVEQDQMIDQIKGALSKAKSLRRSDFDAIFASVLARRQRTRQTLPVLVDAYRANREGVIEAVADLFAAGVAQSEAPKAGNPGFGNLVESWPGLKDRLLNGENTGEREVVAALRAVHTEQEELSAALSGLLSRGERLKISDLKTVARKLASRDSRESAELAALLATSEAAGRNAEMQWRRLAG